MRPRTPGAKPARHAHARPARAPVPTRPPRPALDFARWVLWQDDYLLAVNKPAGVLSQGGEGGAGANVVDLARAYLGRGGIGVLHRIDRNVSGVVLVAKDPRAARGVSLEIQKGAVERVYQAVVRGEAPAGEFAVDALLRKDSARNLVTARSAAALAALPPAESAEYKPARTEFRTLSRFRAPLGPCAVLEAWPITGRSHQIRAHLAFAGLALIGDPKYGVAARGVNRPLLHACAVAFRHPVTRNLVRVEAPVPWDEAQLRALAPP